MAPDSAAFDVLVVGELNADLILSGDVTPAFGQVERLLDDATLALGSSSAILACGLARLGLRVAFAGLVGDDVIGRFMLDSLRAKGIDIAGVRVDPTIKTGLTVILSRGEDRAMLTYLGSIAVLSFADIDLSVLDRARHVHMGSYYLLDGLRPQTPELFAEAQRRGLSVSLDTNYDPAERWDGMDAVLPHVDVLLPNELELLAISRADSVEQGLELMAERVPLVAVKRGGDGATARRGAEVVSVPSIPVTVVDTTGAGDSFDAGFLYGYLAGWELPKALRLACVCGALSTQAAGGTTAQPSLEEALALL